MVEEKAIIRNEAGIHCRPSAVIVKEIGDYSGSVTVTAEAGSADCRSIMGLLTLALEQDTQVTIRVSGPQEAATCARVVALFETRFDFAPK